MVLGETRRPGYKLQIFVVVVVVVCVIPHCCWSCIWHSFKDLKNNSNNNTLRGRIHASVSLVPGFSTDAKRVAGIPKNPFGLISSELILSLTGPC